MNTGDMIFTVIGAFLALMGLASLVTGKVYSMGASANNYTEESLARYARPSGFARLLMGAGVVASHLLNAHLFNIGNFDVSVGFASMIVCFVVGIAISVASSKLLVKKVAC